MHRPSVNVNSKCQPLLRILAVATEQQLQLPPLLKSFAQDLKGRQRKRVARLAELMEEGSSLPASLEQIPHVLPREDVLAIRCGAQSGTMAATLWALANSSDTSRQDLQRKIQHTFVYVVSVLLILATIMSLLMARTLPTYLLMLSDYGAEVPAALRFTVAIVDQRALSWSILLVGVLFVSWCLSAGWPGKSFRGGWLGRLPWLDTRSADLLQNLSIVTQAGRPIPGALSTLARYHHDPSLRRKLLFVRNEVEQGADLWATSLRVKLLTTPEVELIEASARVGNRPWALEQLAIRQRRRVQRRLEFLGELIQPAAILLLGFAVLAFCWAAYSPLIRLILMLS